MAPQGRRKTRLAPLTRPPTAAVSCAPSPAPPPAPTPAPCSVTPAPVPPAPLSSRAPVAAPSPPAPSNAPTQTPSDAWKHARACATAESTRAMLSAIMVRAIHAQSSSRRVVSAQNLRETLCVGRSSLSQRRFPARACVADSWHVSITRAWKPATPGRVSRARWRRTG